MIRLGDYSLGPPLGAGGMATVSSAHHRVLGLPAAVKIVRHVDDDLFLRAFFAEARAQAGLEHPHIVRLLDFGHVASTDEPPPDVELGRPYLVMEKASGSLRELMPLQSWAETRDVLLQILDALAYSHARGVVHRDLKPENVLYFDTPDGRVFKLSDFGIAAPLQVESRDDRDTLRTAAGTPPYMPPEQLRGQATAIGPWTDLYALGCIAWELTTGATPFQGGSAMAIALKHVQEPLPEIVRLRPWTPETFEAWMRRLLVKPTIGRVRAAADAAQTLLAIDRAHEPAPADTPPTPREPRSDLLTTIVDLTDALSFSDTVDLAPVVASPGASDTREAVRAARMPDTWRRRNTANHETFWGLGLLPLRRVPFPGLDAQRDTLWGLLRRAAQGERVAVLVHGADDAPVLALADWLCERAVETGAATVVATRHSAEGGPGEGLSGIITALFGLDRVEPSSYHRETREALHAEDPRSEIDAAILANEVLLSRGESPRGRVASSVTEVHEAIRRAFELRASERPVILRLDAVEHALESTAFADFLLTSTCAPWLLIATSSRAPDAAGTQSFSAWEELDADLVDAVHVRRFDHSELEDIARSLVPLTRDAAARVAGQNPAPVVLSAILAELVDTGGLELSGTRFALAEDTVLPDTAVDLYARRLDRAFEALAPEYRSAARTATALAAYLGDSPDGDELLNVCEHLDITLPPDLDAELAGAGLIRASRSGWHFLHPSARQAAMNAAPHTPEASHRAIAETLEARSSQLRPSARIRVAAHWKHADIARAWDHFVAAYEELVRRDPTAAASAIHELEALRPRFGADAVEKELVLRLLRAQQRMADGHPLDVSELNALHRRSENAGFPRGVGMALQLRARFHLYDSNLEAALTDFARAANTFAALGLVNLEANAAFGLGFVAYRRADFDTCESSYRRAADLFGRTGNEERQASVLLYLAAAFILRDRFDDASEVTEQALVIARKLQAWPLIAEASSDAGEAARFRGDFAKARENYEEAAYWRRVIGSREAPLAMFNLALVDVGEGEWESALETLGAVESAFREMGSEARLADLIQAARAVCLIGGGEPRRGVEALMTVAENFREQVDRDFAWLAEIAAGRLDGSPASSTMRRLAASQYKELGLVERARALTD